MVAEWVGVDPPRIVAAWPSAVRGRASGHPRRPAGTAGPAGDAGFVARPVRARPPIGDDLSLFGFSRRSRSRLGSRVFRLFFVLVFGLIFVQMIYSILYP